MDEISKSGRIRELDIAKCLGIFVLLVEHVVFKTETGQAVTNVFVSFLMVFFFLVSAYNYKPGKRTYLQNVGRRAKQLLLPMLIYAVCVYSIMGVFFMIKDGTKIEDVFICFVSNIFIGDSFNVPGISLRGNPLMGAIPAWFIQFMFTGYLIFYAVADYALKNARRFISVVAGLLIAASALCYFGVELPWGIHVAPAIAAIMLIGAMLGKNRVFTEQPCRKGWTAANFAVSCAIILFLYFFFNRFGTIGGGHISGVDGENGYLAVFVSVILAITGTCFFVTVSRVIASFKYISKPFVWIGQRTMKILFLHFAFKQVLFTIFGLPQNKFGEYSETTPWTHLLVLLLMTVGMCVLIFVWEKIRAWFSMKLAAKKEAKKELSAV